MGLTNAAFGSSEYLFFLEVFYYNFIEVSKVHKAFIGESKGAHARKARRCVRHVGAQVHIKDE